MPLTPSAKEKNPDGKAIEEFGEIVTLLLREGHLSKEQFEYAGRVRSKLEAPHLFLDVIKELKYITADQIKDVLRANIGSIHIGNLLFEFGHISKEDLQASLKIQASQKTKKKLGEILVTNNFIEERSLIEVLSLQLGIPLAELELTEVDQGIASKASVPLYEAHDFVPVCRKGHEILVAFADPMNKSDIQAAKKFFGNDIIVAIDSRRSITKAIKRIKTGPTPSKFATLDESSVVEIVDATIVAAIERKASDIHIEPMHDRLHVRFRQDGILTHYKDFSFELISDITERRRHQGGRLVFEHAGQELDLRVSFYVTIYGEKIVLRLLNRQDELINIKDIGIAPRILERFREDAIDQPSGVLIATGPTGSGKTTTVYSIINYLKNPQTSIITAEDIVRQDPDVIVIGEIRDTFSANVAVQAALTGHKVLTTFHTEDSIGGLIRLLNMDIDAFLISSTVVCVMAQRLLRKVCLACKLPYQPTPRDIRRMGCAPKDLSGAAFQEGRGCFQCDYSGYKGRTAVFEMLILDEPIRDSILERKTSHQIRNVSIQSTGLITLLEDGIVKAASGITTIEEILRCLPRFQKPRPLAELRRLSGV
ncbi:MAG: Flp pilus assembly complex ATPase component TadA [Deltaproteobacteria bacterium]|nr:Flp pilus assembly complex ATPase component TadA [Deltaproteobacteria bacterium]